MEAIVLARRDFRETDQIISVYTKEKGKIDALARGVKKITSKNAPHLEPFSYILIDIVPGKEIDHVTKVQPVRFFSGIRADIDKSLLASRAVWLAHRLVEQEEADARIFDLLKTWLLFVEHVGAMNPLLLDGLVVKLFDILGFSPLLEQCVACGKSFRDIMRDNIEHGNRSGFYFAGGGLVCAECSAAKRSVDERVMDAGLKEISDMSMLLHGDWRVVSEFALRNTERKKVHALVYEFALYHSEKKLPDWENDAFARVLAGFSKSR